MEVVDDTIKKDVEKGVKKQKLWETFKTIGVIGAVVIACAAALFGAGIALGVNEKSESSE